MFTFCMLTSERFEFFPPDKLMFPVYRKEFQYRGFLNNDINLPVNKLVQD